MARAGRHQQRLGAGADRARAAGGSAGVASGRRSRRALGAVQGAAARAPGGLRPAGRRVSAGGGSCAAGAGVPLSAQAGRGAGPAPAPRRRPHRAHAEERVDGWHAPTPVRAAHAAGEAGGAHPGPRLNLVLYHGVLAPHSGWRARVVAYGAPAAAGAVASAGPEGTDEATPVVRHWAWANLMRRAFDIDVLACPRCGGRLRLIATVEDPDAIRTILVALGESRDLAGRAPPFAAAQPPGPRGDRRLSGSRSPRLPRSVRGPLGRVHHSGPALRSRRKSCDTPVIRAVPGGRTATRDGRAAVLRTDVPSTGPL